MQLIQAINSMLVAAGETTIAALDFSHPLQRALLASLEEVSQLEQSKGWWFNEYHLVLTPNEDGEITVPDAVVSIKPTANQRRFVRKGNLLMDKTTRSTVFDKPVEAYFIEQWDFEDLPPTFAMYVSALASMRAATSYDADAARIQALGTGVELARQPMMKEHVDNTALNLLETPSMGGKMFGVRHQRYGVGNR